MTTVTTKLQLGTVALAMAAAGAITPVIAQADSFAPMAPSLTSFAKALGSTAGTGVCDVTSGVDCTSAVNSALVASKQASATGGIFKNNLTWWGGNTLPGPTQNADYYNNPNTVQVWTFTPLNAVLWAKPFIPGLWTWFEGLSSQSCVLGITTTLGGPYSGAGQLTRTYNHGGCDPK